MTTRITGYSGPVEPRTWFSYKSTLLPNTLQGADPEFLYEVRNPSIFEVTVTFTTSRRSIVMHRRASRRDARFDGSFGIDTYVFDALSAADLNEIFDAHDLNQLTVLVSYKVRYLKFFSVLLQQMTRATGDTFNLARSDVQSTVEASFHHRRHGSQATVTHIDEQRELLDIPAMLSSWDIYPAARPGDPPLVKLYVYLLVRERLAADQRDEAARLLVTSDYSRLYLMGMDHPPGGASTMRLRDVWSRNVLNYLWSHTDMARGERIRQEIIGIGSGALGQPVLQAVNTVRTAIDQRLVTANHWGDRREDWGTERYQRKLSDLFGAIHQRRWVASPVNFLRWLEDSLRDASNPLNVDQQAALALQYGAGHCGEHSQVSFSVIRSLIANSAAGASLFGNVIMSGYANIDHAFVVGGFRVTSSIEVVPRGPLAPDPIDIFDLPTALAADGNPPGFVLDPYLAPGRFSRTAQDLVTRIARPHGRGGRTRYITIWDESPTPLPSPTVTGTTPPHI